MNPSGNELYKSAFLRGITPEPKLLVSEWADLHRELPKKAAAEPGKYRTSRTPYLKQPMDCLSPSDPTQIVVIMKGAQVGATEAGNNWIGHTIDVAPGPFMLVMPTVELVKRTSKLRLQPMIDSTPRLREKVTQARARDSGNTVLSKEFEGGVLLCTGANSAVGLRSTPVRYLMLDEPDGYPDDVDGEGDPIKLAYMRTATYSSKRKIFIISTPTVHGESSIETAFLQSDQRWYHVPCPECHTKQVIKWDNLRFDRDEEKNLIPSSVYLECIECGHQIKERNKTWMLENGEWIASAESDVAGFHISGLYSPLGWYSWNDAIKEFLESKKDPSKLKTWHNTVLGETWQEIGDAPDVEIVKSLRGPYDLRSVTTDAQLITGFFDPGKYSTHFELRAWGSEFTSWQVDHGEIVYDIEDPTLWEKMYDIIYSHYGEMPVRLTGVDSGFSTDRVYEFVRKNVERVRACKGASSQQRKPITQSAQDVNLNGKQYGMRLWMLDTFYFKDWVHSRLRRDPELPGAWHLSHATTDDYCEQLISETRVERNGKALWLKRHKANHYFDCAVGNSAMAHLLGVQHNNSMQKPVSKTKSGTAARKLNG